jgi:hypothetical protein
MRTMNIHSLTAVFGLCLMPALAAAADEPAAAAPAAAAPAAEPAAPAPAAEPAAPAPAAEAAPAPAAAPAADPVADTGAAEAAPASSEAPSTVINLDVEAASAYVWRGMNLFGVDQNTQAFSVFPSLTATFGGLSIGYWGAFQLSGDNKSTLVDTGVGAEQDFILKYSGSLAEGLAYSAMLTYWIYPMADEVAAGTSTPMYIEPGASLTYSTGADLGLYVGYYRGLQEDATTPYSFIYINPSVGKTLPLSGDISLALGLSAGYKVFTNDPATDQDKAFDLTLNVGATIPFSDMYITPQLHAAYVTRDDGVVPDAEFSDSFIAWAGIHVGYNIGL